jgi:hypothetical protein
MRHASVVLVGPRQLGNYLAGLCFYDLPCRLARCLHSKQRIVGHTEPFAGNYESPAAW